MDDEDLQYLISLIKSQIHHPFINLQHRLNKMCGFLLSIDNSLSQLKVHLMNSIAIKLHVKNPRPISVYKEGRATREHILNILVTYLIKSDL